MATNFTPNPFIKVGMASKVVHAVSKTVPISFNPIYLIYLQLELLHHQIKFIPFSSKVCKKMKSTGFALC